MAGSNSSSIQPIKAKNRIVFLDILRGFALLGILFANILSWSGLKFIPIEEIRDLGNFEVDLNIYHYLKFFIDTKFYTIFSILFGVGFYLQISKNKEDPSFPRLYLWRMVLLLGIGILHAIIWSGDILSLYAIMGMILLMLRNIPVEKTIYVGLGLFFFPVLLSIIYMYTFASEIPILPKTALTVYSDMTPLEVKAGLQSTEPFIVLKTNLHNLMWRWISFIPSGRPFKILGLFFLGGYLYSNQFFSKQALQWKYITLFLFSGLIFTGISTQIEGNASSWSRNWTDILGMLTHEIGQLTLAMSYICILAKLVAVFPHFIFFKWLKNYGRMSLTSYLGHTFLGILIFYPIAGLFGYFGRLSLESTYYIAIIILFIQLLFSNIWFKYFSFGPVEWLWRCAAFRKWFPIRKKKD